MAKRLAALKKLSSSGEFAQLMIAFRRAVNISRDQVDAGESVLAGLPPVEAGCSRPPSACGEHFARDIERRDYDQAMGRLLALKGPIINRFFEGVMVMDTDLDCTGPPVVNPAPGVGPVQGSGRLQPISSEGSMWPARPVSLCRP